MRKPIWKSIIKPKRILAAVFILVLGITAGGNIYLSSVKDRIATYLEGQLTYSVNIKDINYLFPCWVFVRDLHLYPKESKSSFNTIHLPSVRLKIAPWELLRSGEVVISGCSVKDPSGPYHMVNDFFQENTEILLEWLRSLPDNDFRFLLKNFKFNSPTQGKYRGKFVLNIAMTIKEQFVRLKGDFRRDVYRIDPKDVGLELLERTGALTKIKALGVKNFQGLYIDSMTVSDEDSYAQLWGQLGKGILELNGYGFINKPLKKARQTGLLQKWGRRARDILEDMDIISKEAKQPDPVVYLLDMNARIRLGYPRTEISDLSFKINKNDVRISGVLDLSQVPELDLEGRYSIFSEGQARGRAFRYINAAITLRSENKVLRSDGMATIGIGSDLGGEDKKTEREVRIEYHDLRLNYDVNAFLSLSAGDMLFRFRSFDDQYKLRIDNLALKANELRRRFLFLTVSSDLYQGRLSGRVWVDAGKTPVRVNASLDFDQVEANDFHELLDFFNNAHGPMSGKINFINYPEVSLSGEARIIEGKLHDYEFFKWLAESFDLPSVRRFGFEKVYTRFVVDEKQYGLTDLDLDSADLSIQGFYLFDYYDLVRSKMTLNFSRELLRESRKFKPILNMFEEDVKDLDFQFQMSGNKDAMNFKWLDSDVKQRIQSRIPDFIERKIERGIGEMMEPVPEPSPSPPPQAQPSQNF